MDRLSRCRSTVAEPSAMLGRQQSASRPTASHTRILVCRASRLQQLAWRGGLLGRRAPRHHRATRRSLPVTKAVLQTVPALNAPLLMQTATFELPVDHAQVRHALRTTTTLSLRCAVAHR
jgi:hypothetical protein